MKPYTSAVSLKEEKERRERGKKKRGKKKRGKNGQKSVNTSESRNIFNVMPFPNYF